MSTRLTAILALCLATTVARAESSRINIHLDVAGVVAGGPGLGGAGGGGLNLGFDYQIKPPVALDFTIGAGGIAPFDTTLSSGGAFMFNTAFGVRLRFLDNREGYLNQKGGDAAGNLFLVPRLGFMAAGDPVSGNVGLFATLDAMFGYEWSVVKPMQLGVFVRPGVGVGTGVIGYMFFGICMSFEAGPKAPVWDSDGDKLSNEREVMKYKTNPHHPDTDLDGLQDGKEVELGTNPLDPDTDHGGARDGWEVQNGRNPLDPNDDDLDQDKVPDDRDACPGTPPGTEVDQRGCAVLRREMVLDGITFRLNSADILPSSQQTLQRALQTLRDNPRVRVEVAGHTDDLGKPDYNQRLSEARAGAVVSWLISQGIEPARMMARGYGATQPKAANDSEPNRAKNRRIEFRRLSE
jgi:outer membrane protein OmpA-like peptidoglycan-associated protein